MKPRRSSVEASCIIPRLPNQASRRRHHGPASGSPAVCCLRRVSWGPAPPVRRFWALDAIAIVVARRIDAIRITAERYERELSEREVGKLATEAELRALRAQINPHFLFNALTTIGYLIQTAPPRALQTLLRLTALLRAVLRSEGEWTTLGRELELVEAYLDIERARFEERLRVTIEVPATCATFGSRRLCFSRSSRTPSNTGSRMKQAGGEVMIRGANRSCHEQDPSAVGRIMTGGGFHGRGARARARGGVGLRNVERRLACQYGPAASLSFRRHSIRARPSRYGFRLRSRRRPSDARRGGSVSARLRIVVADDERPARSFLVSLLRSFEDVQVVGEAKSGKEAVALIERDKPDLVLLDWQMPELDGIGVVRLLKKDATCLAFFGPAET